MNRNWDKIVELYKQEACAHEMRITKEGNTALHIAISQGNEQKVKDLVQQIRNKPVRSKEALQIKNDRGNTPLHIAASKGNVNMCQCIANGDQQFVGVPNGDGETPFFLSVRHGRKEAFFYLHDICGVKNGYIYSRRKDGDTILHCAITGDYFDLAFQITHSYPNLVNYKNEEGLTPLHVLASKPSAFRSSSILRGYNKIIYHCIFVDNLQVEASSHDDQTKGTKGPVDDKDLDVPENYKTCTKFFKLFWDITKVVTCKRSWNGEQTDAENPEGQPGHQLVPANYRTCFEFAKLASMAMLIVFGVGFTTIRKIEQKKQKHERAVQVLHALLTLTSTYEYDAGAEPNQETSKQEGATSPYDVKLDSTITELSTTSNEKKERAPEQSAWASSNDSTDNYVNDTADNQKKNTTHSADEKVNKLDTPILIAAKNGITEIVDEILNHFPVAIEDLTVEEKNIVLLAVENRQPTVYQLLLKRKDLQKESVFGQVDNEGNSAEHLAARLGECKPWWMSGAAMQMQWENNWYEYIRDSMPPNFFRSQNNYGMTPSDLFTESHKELVREGSEWLKNTAQSCSVISALIATVAFATSTTVPGGFKEEFGIPALQTKPEFDLFAISSLVALCFSIISLVMLLSIITSRYQDRDFGKILPRKLLLGLTSMIVSIAAILISFCAGHFFVLRKELRSMAVPMYVIAFLSILFFTLTQFSLFIDVLRATCKKVPQRQVKRSTYGTMVPTQQKKRRLIIKL